MTTANTTEDTRDYVQRDLTRMLPVKLTDAELVERSTKLVELNDELTKLEGELAHQRTVFKEKAEAIEAQVNSLSNTIRSRSEERPITCDAYFEQGVVKCVRRDTNEVFETRPASQSDVQVSLGDRGLFDEAAARMAAGGDDVTDTDPNGPDEDIDDEPAPVAKKPKAKKAKGKKG